MISTNPRGLHFEFANIILCALLLLIVVRAAYGHAYQKDPCSSPAQVATADALAEKFGNHQFVFIGATHGDAKIEEFLMCLITRPSFKERVTDIVVESTGSGHQQLIDRYILTLAEVANDDLAAIWFDTDEPRLWATLPQVREFAALLREVNRTLAPARRIRLVGGNDGVDWTKVQVAEDLAPYPFKTNFMEHLLIEHLAKTPGNRTLVVYGDGHIRYKGNNFMGEVEYSVGRAKLYVVGRIGELNNVERPYLAALGDPNKPFFVDAPRFPTNIPWPQSLKVAFDERSERLADYIDGFVYLGPERDRDLRGKIPFSTAQQQELDRRAAIKADQQRTMRARLKGRDRWFSTHPNDFSPRPPVKE